MVNIPHKVNISIKAWTIFYFIILLLILPQRIAGSEINKLESKKETNECTASEVLNRLGKVYRIKVTMNKNIQNKISCNEKFGRDMNEVIKNLLFQEKNYAVVWNLKDNVITSVDIRFFGGTYNDTAITMTAQQDQHGSAEMNIDAKIYTINNNINLRSKSDALLDIKEGAIASHNFTTNLQRKRETELNMSSVNTATDNRTINSQRIMPVLKNELPSVTSTPSAY